MTGWGANPSVSIGSNVLMSTSAPHGAGGAPVGAAAAPAAPAATVASPPPPPLPPAAAAAAPAQPPPQQQQQQNGHAPPLAAAQAAAGNRMVIDDSSDSDDDVPLAARAPALAAAAAAPSPPPKPAAPPSDKQQKKKARHDALGAAVALPAAPPRPKPAAPPKPAANGRAPSDSDEDAPLAARRRSLGDAGHKKEKRDKKEKKHKKERGGDEPRKRRASGGDESAPKRPRPSSGGGSGGGGGGGSQVKWQTLEHAGVLFPPAYEPHGVKMLYDGVPVDLTPEQEEVATFYAGMKETDYMQKETFKKNFWEGFRAVLGPGHVVKRLDKCDFDPIHAHLMADRERKRAASKEEKAAAKAARDAAEAKYKWALVDGRREQVGNFRVEPPGLFRGRGEHPKMGRLKRRIFPRDITINIGRDAPVPEHPFPGQRWAEVRHDNTVTWLAFWKDPVNTKEYKYVFLAANSAWKSESDLQKYEKARKLKAHIGAIRAAYTRDWGSKSRAERQMATALYFIDRLALRAGHDKDEDEADTVGCCTLKAENVELRPPATIRFDFLGKDSIRYENDVEVDARVYANVAEFKARAAGGRPKAGGEQLFDEFVAQDLNVRLKELMDGLSVKVFRTYNASVTLDRLLADVGPEAEPTVDGRKAAYDRANKEVAVLCNHQRAVAKGHSGQMEKMNEKLAALRAELAALEADLRRACAGKPTKAGKAVAPEALAARAERKRAALDKAEIAARVKEDLKTVALGTSKINYLDPRISVAWCKRAEVPMEKVFNKSLLSKFAWAMDVDPDFRF